MLFFDQTFAANCHVYNKIMLLSREEIEDPNIALVAFFESLSLSEIREYLYKVKRVALTTENTEFFEARSRSDMIFVLERIEQLAEASSILADRHNKLLRQKRDEEENRSV